MLKSGKGLQASHYNSAFLGLIFSLGRVTIPRDVAEYGNDVDFLVQEEHAGPPESKINLPLFEAEA